jgi:hypothetical protein
MIYKNKYRSNTSGISNISYDSNKKAWVYEKYIDNTKHRKRFYGKKDDKIIFERVIKYKVKYEDLSMNKL